MYTYSFWRDYLEFTERFLDDEMVKIETRLAEIRQRLPHAPSRLVYDLTYSPGFYSVTRAFPDVVRKSIFIAAYSEIELDFRRLCEWFARDYGFPSVESKTDKRIKGKGIPRYKDYLTKIVDFKLPDSLDWSEMLMYNKLRNCIVHNESRIEEYRYASELKAYVSRNATLKLDGINIVIQKGFCEKVLDEFEKFQNNIDQCYFNWGTEKREKE